VTIDRDKGMEIADRATKEPVPYPRGPQLSRGRVSRDYSTVGYKVYELRAAHTMPPASQRTTTTIESSF